MLRHGCPTVRRAVKRSRALATQPVPSLSTWSWPLPGTVTSCDRGSSALTLTASSTGVRMSSRPASSSAGTSGSGRRGGTRVVVARPQQAVVRVARVLHRLGGPGGVRRRRDRGERAVRPAAARVAGSLASGNGSCASRHPVATVRPQLNSRDLRRRAVAHALQAQQRAQVAAHRGVHRARHPRLHERVQVPGGHEEEQLALRGVGGLLGPAARVVDRAAQRSARRRGRDPRDVAGEVAASSSCSARASRARRRPAAAASSRRWRRRPAAPGPTIESRIRLSVRRGCVRAYSCATQVP